jgi:TolB protein
MKSPFPMRSTRFIVLFCSMLISRSFAQEDLPPLERTSASVAPIPISLTGYSGEVQKVLKNDLEVMGFKVVNPETAQYNVTGSNEGQVEGRVTDRISKENVLAKRYQGAPLRVQTHAFADDIVLKITGKPGIAQTKITFKGGSGVNSEIFVADYDGANAVAVTKDRVIVAAPAWAPGRRALYYTSYKSGYPDIYSHDLNSGQRKIIANYPGLNTSAAVSPDGKKVALILSKGGSPNLYVCDADGTNLKQLTQGKDTASSPCWSPDSRTICFVSNEGTPSLYLIPAQGGAKRKLRTAGVGRATEPDWSPDGKWIVFTAQWKDFAICKVPAQGGEAEVLVAGEDPSWAPNSRTVIFTRRTQDKDKRVLSLLDVPTKQVKDVAQNSGSCSQPSWAK